jgi:hypothetical protein
MASARRYLLNECPLSGFLTIMLDDRHWAHS